MKFIKEVTPKGLLLPVTAARLAGFSAGEKVEYHALKGAMVVLKGQMSAMELLTAARSLQELAVELHTHLAKVCGQCDGCGKDAENGGEGCPLTELEADGITLPDYLLEEAGIPEGTKLCAEVDEEENTVTIFPAGYDHDLRDLPPETLEMFLAANVCLGELEERLMVGDPVYGG